MATNNNKNPIRIQFQDNGGLPIDYTLNSFIKKTGTTRQRTKTLIEQSKSFGNLAKIFSRTAHSRKSDISSISRPRTHIPWEVEPLLSVYLRVKHENMPEETMLREFINQLSKVKSQYFLYCLNSDGNYQYLLSNQICIEPLIERLSSILLLSTFGKPSKRLEMLRDCLISLECLINDLIYNYFTLNNKAWLELTPHFSTDKSQALFEALYNSLLCEQRKNHGPNRPPDMLTLTKTGQDQKKIELAKRLKANMEKIKPGRGTEKSKIFRQKARKDYELWLISQMKPKKIKEADNFSEDIKNVADYLAQDKCKDNIRQLDALIEKEFLQFVNRLLKPTYAEINMEATELLPSNLFIIQKVKEYNIEIAVTMYPYLELDVAFNTAAGLITCLMRTPDYQSALLELIKGTKNIIQACQAKIKKMQTILGFRFKSITQDTLSNNLEENAQYDANVLYNFVIETIPTDIISKLLPPNIKIECSNELYQNCFLTYSRYSVSMDADEKAGGIVALQLIFHLLVYILAYKLAATYHCKLAERLGLQNEGEEILRTGLEKRKWPDHLFQMINRDVSSQQFD